MNKRKRLASEDIEDLCSSDSPNEPNQPIEVVDHRFDYHTFTEVHICNTLYHFLTGHQEEINTFRSKLLAWYDVSQRCMPWRKPSEKFARENEKGQNRQEEWDAKEWDHAYGVLVSEIMLQQTQ